MKTPVSESSQQPAVPEGVKGLNHWSVGMALLGMAFSLAPSALEIGVGLSAIGILFYAVRKRHYPFWCLLSSVPVLGTLMALIALTILPCRVAVDGPPSCPVRFFFSPLLWTVVILLLSILAWMTLNPAAVFYRTGHR